MRALELSDLGCQVGATPGEEVAAPGQQTTGPQSVGRNFTATHSTIALFDPPPDRPFASIIGLIEVVLPHFPYSAI